MENDHLHQEIYLEPNPDGESYPIASSDVQVHTCRVYERTRDSSKVRSRAIIDYRWETKVYDGRLVSVHKDGTYLAYVLHSRNTCSVRVINRSTKARALIKNFVGQAVDLTWAFTSWPHLLAISDEGGNVVIYNIEEHESASEINTKKYLRIENSNSVTPRQSPHRLVWCPYVPDNANVAEESGDEQQLGNGTSSDPTRLLAIFYGPKVDVLNVEKILKEYGEDTTFAAIEAAISSMEIDNDISAVAISPDVTALALSSHGGEVKFYILENGDLMHAQTWKPHKGRPVTSIVFLDNFLAETQSEEGLWKYLVTACEGNRELKLWSCENWDCLATIRIDPPEAQSVHTALTLTADWTSSYIFLTDIERKSLYVVEIVPFGGRVRFSSFTEFPLLHPALSLAVVTAGPKRFRPTSPGATSELEDSGENDFMNMVGVQAFLYAVNPKSLLELDIRFVPPRRDDGTDESLLSTVSSCKLEAIRDELSDLSVDMLRSAPSASDVAKTAGTDFSNFNLARRGSTPLHSGSPNERTPTRELDVEQRISASPSSQEVSKILANPLANSASGDEDPSCLADANNAEEDDERPSSPIPQTLLTLATPAVITMVDWEQPNAILQPTAAVAMTPDYAALTTALSTLSSELALTSTSVARQEEQLQHLKHLVSSQQSMWEAVLHLVQDRDRQESAQIEDIYQKVESLKPEQFRQSLTRAVEEAVQTGLDSTVTNEIRTVLATCMAEAFKGLKESVQGDVAQKLTATDTVVRENIGKMLKSKPIVDAIGQAAGQAAASVATAEANAAYRESFQKIIAPSFESTARGLFTQMNDAFQRGTKEYLDQLQRQSAIVQHNTEEWKKSLSNQLLAFADQLKVTSERQLSVMQTNMEKHFEQLTQRLQESLFANVRSVVQEEVAKAVADGQQALNDTVMKALRSQAPTPVPFAQQPDRTLVLNEINQSLAAGQFNSAFQQALQARDVSIVNHVCQRVDPGRLFGENVCPLQQPILLSLLHQLSVDLGNNTELKLNYMQEAIPSIDAKILNDNSLNAIRQIREKVATFLQANPTVPHARKVKSVLMLLNSLATA